MQYEATEESDNLLSVIFNYTIYLFCEEKGSSP